MSEIREDQKARISIEVAENSHKEFECLVKDLQKDRLSLNFPKEMMSYAHYLGEGEEIPVKIFTPSGIRVFNAMILDSPLESEFVIEYVEDNIQVQRREYSRSRLKTKIIIERRTELNVVTQTIDIGGGGIRFYYEGEFAKNELVDCRLYLPGQVQSIKATGNIVHKPHLLEHEHVILFSKIIESERDKIVKKCFDIQAESYKRI